MSIRKAGVEDVSRIVEILVFSKRKNYRSIFNDDIGSFVELQVYPLIKTYLEHQELLENIFVYDDGIIKGMIHIEEKEVVELYVDYFFWNEGIGSKLIEFAKEKYDVKFLWVLEKNSDAIRFYKAHGFILNGERELEESTTEYKVMLNKK